MADRGRLTGSVRDDSNEWWCRRPVPLRWEDLPREGHSMDLELAKYPALYPSLQLIQQLFEN
ncbi:MAG: hypothetical protein WCF03_13340 [Nitrososphaeraceae archaeon]